MTSTHDEYSYSKKPLFIWVFVTSIRHEYEIIEREKLQNW
jgi:hypothetical protein